MLTTVDSVMLFIPCIAPLLPSQQFL